MSPHRLQALILNALADHLILQAAGLTPAPPYRLSADNLRTLRAFAHHGDGFGLYPDASKTRRLCVLGLIDDSEPRRLRVTDAGLRELGRR